MIKIEYWEKQKTKIVNQITQRTKIKKFRKGNDKELINAWKATKARSK